MKEFALYFLNTVAMAVLLGVLLLAFRGCAF